MRIPIILLQRKIYFQAPKEIIKKLHPYIQDIREGKLDRIPLSLRGIFSPIIVRKLPDGKYLVVDGNHRVAIFDVLGISEIEAKVL